MALGKEREIPQQQMVSLVSSCLDLLRPLCTIAKQFPCNLTVAVRAMDVLSSTDN